VPGCPQTPSVLNLQPIFDMAKEKWRVAQQKKLHVSQSEPGSARQELHLHVDAIRAVPNHRGPPQPRHFRTWSPLKLVWPKAYGDQHGSMFAIATATKRNSIVAYPMRA